MDQPSPFTSISADQLSWQPLVLNLHDAKDRVVFGQLATAPTEILHCDTIEEQLRDLLAARNPARDLTQKDLDALVAAHLEGQTLHDYGSWIYYPWLGKPVHVLPKAEYHELRTDRNRDKITREEQAILAKATIGVVGLSVGQASAVTLALEGIAGAFRLADFDTLALSNLNRLRAGCHELGINKSVLAARQMFENDPYLSIEIYPTGITPETIGGFLGEGPARLDILVEECDDFYMKLKLRELARDRGVAVIMDTNDRGLVDIERYDLQPWRLPFHGMLQGLQAEELRTMSIVEKVPHLMKIMGAGSMSPRLMSSLPAIKRTISTWPQLASGVALGSSLIADVSRRILLGELRRSGRFCVDLDAIIADAGLNEN